MKPSEVKPGDRFGNLIVQSIQQHYRSSTGRKDGFEATCLCDCGNQKTVTLSSLVSGHTTSCGCLQKQSHVNSGRKTGLQNIKHALASLSSHPEIRQETCRKIGKKTGSENIKHAHTYLSSYPEILQQNGRKTGSENIRHAHLYLASHPEILRENGSQNIKHANAFLDSHPEIRQENGRRVFRHAIEAQRRDPNFESSLQKEYRLFLEQNNFPYETEFLLDNHYFDFKVNSFLVEINGDIYHSSKYENLLNPTSNGPSVGYKSSSYHRSLLDLATSNGYHLIQLWEYNSFEFNSSLLKHQLYGSACIDEYVEIIGGYRVICNDYGFNIQGTYLPDSGKWISTSSHEIVPESYSKGKVLVFNSGYTILGEQECI